MDNKDAKILKVNLLKVNSSDEEFIDEDSNLDTSERETTSLASRLRLASSLAGENITKGCLLTASIPKNTYELSSLVGEIDQHTIASWNADQVKLDEETKKRLLTLLDPKNITKLESNLSKLFPVGCPYSIKLAVNGILDLFMNIEQIPKNTKKITELVSVIKIILLRDDCVFFVSDRNLPTFACKLFAVDSKIFTIYCIRVGDLQESTLALAIAQILEVSGKPKRGDSPAEEKIISLLTSVRPFPMMQPLTNALKSLGTNTCCRLIHILSDHLDKSLNEIKNNSLESLKFERTLTKGSTSKKIKLSSQNSTNQQEESKRSSSEENIEDTFNENSLIYLEAATSALLSHVVGLVEKEQFEEAKALLKAGNIDQLDKFLDEECKLEISMCEVKSFSSTIGHMLRARYRGDTRTVEELFPGHDSYLPSEIDGKHSISGGETNMFNGQYQDYVVELVSL